MIRSQQHSTGLSLPSVRSSAAFLFAVGVVCLLVPGTLRGDTGATVIERIQPLPFLEARDGEWLQPIRLSLRHSGADAEGTITIAEQTPVPIRLTNGVQIVEAVSRQVTNETSVSVAVQVAGNSLPLQIISLKPVRKLTVFVLPHSHTDIGYTEIQTAIEQKQVNNLLKGIEFARKTADYPDGARFVWNIEVLWAADLYWRRLSEAQRAEFLDALKKGQIALNGMYLNELTGLCRPEELLRLFRFSTELAERCGTTIDSAMISDVPGYTWGTVTAMAQSGIRYFSAAPNHFDRIGDFLAQWEDKPFYWLSPSGKEKVLFWVPAHGYALSHLYHKLTPELVTEYQEHLDKIDYPYEISYVRWSGHGDNATPDPAICEFIRDWNLKYAYPKFVIASTSDAFSAFEKRYGDKIPRLAGDLTPYWEDGAGSSAAETAMNRRSSDRLTQAETLWALRDPAHYPAAAFEQAWRNLLLYSEHTWGADCSVSDPENRKTKEQWAIKQSYALQAHAASQKLLDTILSGPEENAASLVVEQPSAVDVFNTTSWPRTDVVVLSPMLSRAGDRVTDQRGHPLPSQRLSSGELAFLAREVPPFAACRYNISRGRPYTAGKAIARETSLQNGLLQVHVDEKTGSIVELRAKGVNGNFVDRVGGHALNDYLFLSGSNLADIQRNGPVSVRVKESGPLVASLVIESDAPGCNRLTREVRLVAGLERVELLNTVDKERAPIGPKPGDWHYAQTGGKESVNFAFPFKIPNGAMRLDIPLGSERPELDQLPGSCKNWFTVGRWVEVANPDCGITWATTDAPLIEVGDITATLLGSQRDPAIWRKKVEPTQTLYSWAMNNHWGTNYRAYQDGPVRFHYALWPHRRTNPDAAARFAIGLDQPLLATRARRDSPLSSRLRVTPESVIVVSLKPSDDGQRLVVRLFGAGGKEEVARLDWSGQAPTGTWLSDTSERPLTKISGPVRVPAWGLLTLLCQFRNGGIARR